MSSGRQALALTLALALAGCGIGERLASVPRGIEDRPHVVHKGAGFAMSVLEGSVVKTTRDTVSVDAVDGSTWFDVRWIDTTNPIVPIAEANAWAEAACASVHWDLPYEPSPKTWTDGGRCTIGGREHWVIAVVEQLDGHAVLTGIMGRPGAVTHEDLWVEMLGSAMSVQAGDKPGAWIEPSEVRLLLRGIDSGDPKALIPIPGGGVFSGLAAKALAKVWAERLAGASFPDTFDGSVRVAVAPTGLAPNAGPGPEPVPPSPEAAGPSPEPVAPGL